MMSLQSWLNDQVSLLMGFDSPEFADYLLSIQDDTELEEAFFSFFGEGELVQKTWQEFMARRNNRQSERNNNREPERAQPSIVPPKSTGTTQKDDLSSLEQGIRPKKSTQKTSQHKEKIMDGPGDTSQYMQQLDIQLDKELNKTKSGSEGPRPKDLPKGAQRINIPKDIPKSFREKYGSGSASGSGVSTSVNTTDTNGSAAHSGIQVADKNDRMQQGQNVHRGEQDGHTRREHAGKSKTKITWGNLETNIPVVEMKPHTRTVQFSTSGQVFGKNADVAGNSVGHGDSDTPLEESRGEYCPCMATIHNLLGNCLECGKIICEREAAQLCSFCGNTLPWRASRRAIANARGRAANVTREYKDQIEQEQKLLFREQDNEAEDESLHEAIRRKNQLLHFDQTSAERSHVYDDQADYFKDSSSAWLSESEKAEALRKDQERMQNLHERRPNQISLNIDGGNVSVRDHTREIYEKETAKKFGINEENVSRSANHTMKGLVGKRSAAFKGFEKHAVNEQNDSDVKEGDGHASSRPYSNTAISGRAAEIYSVLQADAKKRQAQRVASLRGMEEKPSSAPRKPARVQHSLLEEDSELNSQLAHCEDKRFQSNFWDSPINPLRRLGFEQGDHLPVLFRNELQVVREFLNNADEVGLQCRCSIVVDQPVALLLCCGKEDTVQMKYPIPAPCRVWVVSSQTTGSCSDYNNALQGISTHLFQTSSVIGTVVVHEVRQQDKTPGGGTFQWKCSRPYVVNAPIKLHYDVVKNLHPRVSMHNLSVPEALSAVSQLVEVS